MDSSSSSSFIIPDSPPTEQQLNYWQQQQQQQKQQQEARSSAATSAATAAASAVSAASSSGSPLKRQGIFVQRERGEEIVIPDSLLPQSTPATWAPRRAVLSTQPSKQPVKRRLVFEDEAMLTQSKKRVPEEEEDSSIVPLLREEGEVETEDEDVMRSENFLRLLNSRVEKPWTPLHELEEGLPYPICDVREASNQHGRRIVLKIHEPGLRTTDVYLPERFTRILSTKDIENFKLKCKTLSLFVKHVNAFMTDIKIVKC
ncbi:myb-like protein AA [Nilaparvata lugens]|uniref:myb-like protein AA n=1 Tax=Nilaparvata lugens TaxID=108931 RepID=UPI00193E36AB|nr:myb-like protein AA [Nilaparvata lugens]